MKVSPTITRLRLAATLSLLLVFWACVFPLRADTKRQELKVLSYNLLFSHNPEDPRIPALLEILKNSKADIIALQETSDLFVRLLLSQPWARNYYAVPGRRGKESSRPLRGVFMLSRFPVYRLHYRRFPEGSLRYFLTAHIKMNGRRFCASNVHLASPLKAGPRRASQLKLVMNSLRKCQDIVLLGDFNFGDGEEPETSLLKKRKRFRDLWLSLRPNDPGLTWDKKRNPLARKNSFPGEGSRRLDRILLRSSRWRPHKISRIGTRDSNATTYPASDHFGLHGEIVFH